MKWIIIYFCLIFGEAWCSFNLPSNIKFGAGSSASQFEGSATVDGRTPSIIDTISEQRDLEIGEACKSYELYKRDVEIAKELGLQFYRFTISWSRILPKGFSNETNEAGINYYNNLIDELLANGIEPVVTIFHLDLPQALYDLGAWNNPDFKDWFGDYARVLFSHFGDRVKTWLTINQALVLCYNIATLITPAYEESDVHVCPKNMLLAHATAWRIYDEEFRTEQNGNVSIVNNIVWMEPASNDDTNITELVKQYSFGMYSQPIYSKEGGWPESLETALATNVNATKLAPLSDEEKKFIQGTYDFYAVNYYTSKLVRKATPGETIGNWPFYGSSELEAVLYDSPDWPTTKLKWMTVNPEGLRKLLQSLNKEYGVEKFLIAENGYPDEDSGFDDDKRIEYITNHLEQVSKAVNEDELQVFGYCVWSIMDDFEYTLKYTLKFGLYNVNFTDPLRTRTARKSAQFYRSVINNVTSGNPIEDYP